MWEVNNSFCEEIWRFDEIRKNPEKIRKPDKNPEKNIIISYLISKLSIMSRNIVQIIEIRRFEKSDKKTKKKRDFQTSELRSRSKNTIHLKFKSSYG